MNLQPFYTHYNRNVGRIKGIGHENVTVNICAGHGGGEMLVPINNCCEFMPQVDDRVLLCVDDDGEIAGYFLKKLRKTRQEHK